MNILEQLNKARTHPNSMPRVQAFELAIGEGFEFMSRQSLKVGHMVYITDRGGYVYGRAIITNNPSDCLYKAKRTS